MTTKTSETLAKIAGLDLSSHHFRELSAWLAAAKACGFELPGDALEPLTQVIHLDREQQKATKPAPPEIGPALRLLSGRTAEEVFAEDDAHTAAVAFESRRSQLLSAAQNALQTTIA